MTKASDNAFPSVLITEGTEPSAPAASHQRIYIDSTSHHLSRTDSGGVQVDLETNQAAGGMATDSLWAAAGDVAVATGNNAATVLSLGNAGAVLARINGAVAWNAGTSFPTAAAGDRYFRTDLGLDCYYDGTRWLTIAVREVQWPSNNNSATGSAFLPGPDGGYDWWLISAEFITFLNGGTSNGSNYWTVDLQKVDASNTATTLGSTFVTSSDTASTWTRHTVTYGSSLARATYFPTKFVVTKTAGSPGNLYVMLHLYYRLIVA